jgi:hypothetical protein
MRRCKSIEWFKVVLFICLIVGCQVTFAQSDTVTTNKNKSKINELNQRLDNLVKTTSTISSGDSVEIKLDLLLKQMTEVKQEIATIKTAINTMSAENREALEEYKESKSDGSTQDLMDGKYYVVIGSRRDLGLANALHKELSVSNQVKLVRNSKDTWNHIVLATPYSREEAAQKVHELRKGAFSDSWWTNAKRLQ